MITGEGGSSKIFVINPLGQLLDLFCIVSSYFGIATFSINGITLHTPYCCELKGQTLADLWS